MREITWRDSVLAARAAEAAGDYAQASNQWAAAIFHCPFHWGPNGGRALGEMRRELKKCKGLAMPIDPPF